MCSIYFWGREFHHFIEQRLLCIQHIFLCEQIQLALLVHYIWLCVEQVLYEQYVLEPLIVYVSKAFPSH